jgi:hypothetical protein
MTISGDFSGLASALAGGLAAEASVLCALPPGADVARRLAARIGAERVFSHPTPLLAAGGAGIAVELGAEDLDRAAPRGGLWPGGSLTARSRLRRIDTLYAGRPVGLLVVAGAAEAAAILIGAAQAIARFRPAVLVDGRGGAAQDEGAVGAALPGYTVFRPAEGVACWLPEGQRPPEAEPSPAGSDIAVAFDDDLACGGLHASEPGAPDGGRWTGAAIETFFIVPRPDPGSWALSLAVADWGNAAAGFAALVEGRRLAPATLTARGVAYPALAIAPGGLTLRIALLPPRPIPDLDRWPRKIGLRITRASLLRQ